MSAKPTVKVRRMKEGDLDEVIELGSATNQIQTGTDCQQFYDRETLRRWISYPQSLLLVAHLDEDFAGFRIADYNPAARLGYLEMIVVKPQYRGRGIGEKLYEATMQWLTKQGCQSLWCIIQEDNAPAQKFYTTRGFQAGRSFRVFEKELKVEK